MSVVDLSYQFLESYLTIILSEAVLGNRVLFPITVLIPWPDTPVFETGGVQFSLVQSSRCSQANNEGLFDFFKHICG